MNKSEIGLEEYNSYYQPYIDKAGTGNVFDDLRSNHETIILFLKSIPVEKLHYRYAKGKWTIKEILLHLIDTERVFAYRAMCIARSDKTELPGFDQDDFVAHSNADKRSMESLLSEYQSVRKATISLFESFNQKSLARIGTVSHSRLSVRAIALIILGHESHHLQMIKEHYL
ncbi:DinB family protein [Gelidibacter japonicus]|uniref:DinB family protein n=1 Tax=Gelidibacter japonicus TaxID=1962232 RepID=UPI00201FF5B7|nr:DinB family protein [Gelidibacter japonicus]MCL8005984.1 DinB family protein [Gelidibacter japonicus]